MKEDQFKNIEQAIDDLCENLVWTWAYFSALKNMHEVAKTTPEVIEPFPEAISCLYHGLFDALFVKLYHFLDSTRRTCGLPALFKILRRYCQDDIALMTQVKQDMSRIKAEANFDRVKNWRNEVVAHLTISHRESSFFSDNKLHLAEIEKLIQFLEDLIEGYSQQILNRFNDVKYPSNQATIEFTQLIKGRKAEQTHRE